MRLPHNPETVAAMRTPTLDDPWRILISGCLAGWHCGVDATDMGLSAARPPWMTDARVTAVPFCPEAHQLGSPRNMPDLHGGDGFDVLDGNARVLDEHRTDLTEAILAGARAMLALAQAHRVDFAILLDRSGTCGSQVVSVGCRLELPVRHRRGVGVATALLLRHGVCVVSQRDPHTLGRLGEKLHRRFAAAPGTVDHHRHPWVLANLPTE